MKKELKKVALYDPYLDTLGGGEKYILSIFKVLSEENFEISIFWDNNLSSEIEKQLSLQLINKLEFLPNVFRNSSLVDKLMILKDFDYFFYITDGSYFFSTAKKNFIYAMVPQKNLYRMNFINRLKTRNYQFITHSKFTQNWLNQMGIKSKLIYPYFDTSTNRNNVAKEKIIFSVGRFFKHLHSKRQDLVIKFFKQLKKQLSFKDFKLILAGGLKKEDKEYFSEIKKLANDDPSIIFKPNISHQELTNLYQKSLFFWHLAGYGINENKNPQLVEHLGMTPLEAMASCCLVFCYAGGGLKETITDRKNGFLFKTGDELIDKMSKIINDEDFQNKIRTTGIKFIKEKFSYEVFKKRTKEIVL